MVSDDIYLKVNDIVGKDNDKMNDIEQLSNELID